MKRSLQTDVNDLADKCLSRAETYHGYSPKDLENATHVFSHFLMDLIFTSNRHLSLEKMEDLAETTGKAIRELIRASTSLDMAEVVKQ